ncbi:outer membrane protein [Desulfocapsa sulfexigens DSM 10523]|uniref:Outer membrane protein n=1 Tax=Desulfocapsa sulfexigens (strain DSM 10523 / SB164P1) TaxID=1167006 RepID=M1PAI9_DESSD|nr:OmpH family outer membrane protein [Desulfocapsa sulfexigens]AGF78667.1 outer membrane protein [Desulfocapsa sulfexigens DSM 10523]
MLKHLLLAVSLVAVTAFTFGSGVAQSAETQKIGVMNIQKVLLESTAGKTAKGVFEKRMNELQEKFKVEQDALIALQQEIEKKSSAWSKDKKGEKIRELQMGQRELQVKSEDAKMELKQLQDKELEPILNMLQTVVNAYGEKNGFSVILDSKVAVLYAAPGVDVSDEVKEELNKRMK